jgi:glucosamine kinase
MGTKGTTYLGIDGGGTRCRARIEDENGTVLGAANSGPATTRIGFENAWRSIMEATEAAAAQAGLTREDFARMQAGIGLAGLGRRGAEAALNKIAHPFASVIFISDGLAACLGAHSGADGAIVVAGTGSVGVGLIDGREIRLAGYGFPVSDEGSGEEAKAADYAAFAPIVMRHANQGDPVGRRIVERAADAIGDLLDLFLARGIDRLSLVGGLADAITPWLTPDLRSRLRCPDADAAAGALLVARGRLDLPRKEQPKKELPKGEPDHEQASKFRV